MCLHVLLDLFEMFGVIELQVLLLILQLGDRLVMN